VLLHDDLAPLPERLTQHSLRHTYISLRVAIGDDPAAVSRDAGHADMGVTFRIYTHVMALQDGDREHLRALVAGSDWAVTGSDAAPLPDPVGADEALEEGESRKMQSFRSMANPGLEPGTPRFSVVCSTN